MPLLPEGKLAWRDEAARHFREGWVAAAFPGASRAERWEREGELAPVPRGPGRPAARWAAFEGYIASLLRCCAFTTAEIDVVFCDMRWAVASDPRTMRRFRERRRRALEALQTATRRLGGSPPILREPTATQVRSAERDRWMTSELRLLVRRGDPEGYVRVTQTTDPRGEERAEAVAVARCVARLREIALHPSLAETLAKSPTFRRRCVSAEIVRLRAVDQLVSRAVSRTGARDP